MDDGSEFIASGEGGHSAKGERREEVRGKPLSFTWEA